MIEAPHPVDETPRLEALQALGILYTPSEERFDRVTRIVRRVFDAPIALMSLIASDVQWFKSAQGIVASETPRRVAFCAHAILQSETMVVRDALLDPRFSDNPAVTGEPGVRFYAGHPLVAEGGYAIGTLCVIDRVPRPGWNDADSAILRDLAEVVQTELRTQRVSAENERLNAERGILAEERDELKRRAMVDALTHVWNRGAATDIMRRELERARRAGRPVSLAMIDIDHFKRINDTWGHPAGDAVLQEIAQRIRGAVRAYDVVGRFGGEEFVVFLPDCGLDVASQLSERIRGAIRAQPVEAGAERLGVTASIGVASYVEDDGLDELIAAADSALYEAKNGGRDQVRAAERK